VLLDGELQIHPLALALDVEDPGFARFQRVERRPQFVEPRDRRAVQSEDDVPGNEFVLPGVATGTRPAACTSPPERED
jgi:hypothetical protein